MFVQFVTDDPTKIPAIRAILEPQHRVETQLLGEDDTKTNSNGVLMVDADLRRVDRVEQLRRVLQESSGVSEKLFVVQNHVRSMISQAYALGATAVEGLLGKTIGITKLRGQWRTYRGIPLMPT